MYLIFYKLFRWWHSSSFSILFINFNNNRLHFIIKTFKIIAYMIGYISFKCNEQKTIEFSKFALLSCLIPLNVCGEGNSDHNAVQIRLNYIKNYRFYQETSKVLPHPGCPVSLWFSSAVFFLAAEFPQNIKGTAHLKQHSYYCFSVLGEHTYFYNSRFNS